MYTDRRKERKRRIEPPKFWIKTFAWFPKKIVVDKSWIIVWLEHYEYTRISKDDYEYRPIKKITKQRRW